MTRSTRVPWISENRYTNDPCPSPISNVRTVSSTPIVTEVLRSFGRPRIRRKYRVEPGDIERLRRFLRSELVSVTITAQVSGIATHPEDDLVLATALSARAGYLVTYDRQLLKLGSYRGVQIVTPYQFLQILQAPSTE